MGGQHIRDMKVLVKDMLTYMSTLDGDEKVSFVKEVDTALNELQEFAAELVPETGEDNDIKE